MTLVLDAGAFLAVERGDVDVARLVTAERRQGRRPLSHGGVVGQVWRGGAGRQARLAHLLPGVDVRPLDEALGRLAGLLLRDAGSSDVVDAAVVLLSREGDEILTSDVPDLTRLVAVRGVDVALVQV